MASACRAWCVRSSTLRILHCWTRHNQKGLAVDAKHSPFYPNRMSRRRFMHAVRRRRRRDRRGRGRGCQAGRAARPEKRHPRRPLRTHVPDLAAVRIAYQENGGRADGARRERRAPGRARRPRRRSHRVSSRTRALSDNNPNNDTHGAGVTFMGQFIDHDLTLDTTSELAVQQQPERTVNYRTPYLRPR